MAGRIVIESPKTEVRLRAGDAPGLALSRELRWKIAGGALQAVQKALP